MNKLQSLIKLVKKIDPYLTIKFNAEEGYYELLSELPGRLPLSLYQFVDEEIQRAIDIRNIGRCWLYQLVKRICTPKDKRSWVQIDRENRKKRRIKSGVPTFGEFYRDGRGYLEKRPQIVISGFKQ